ncbi:MAG TPA: phenylalanine 4-monooxygenase [Pyrinomonadaceae bacterium]|nr:phenylalanine 4-monooxygenase [Blastocatellia bacterium]HRJ90537.1 phenylalanine 4-monooxygenase [Pyrinomonadaceae bacterium]HRK49616.1 phenylalanine 4-monooxygenase [Pyrinomonadaceae bacterium]
MKGAAQMLTETATPPTNDADLAIENFQVSDADLPEFRDMKFENINELHLDHPGANDPEYRARRDVIAGYAKNFRETGEITDVDYSPREQRVWRYVAEELEELQQKYASPFYLRAKKDLGIRTDRIPQLSEMNRRLKELTGFRLAPIEGLVETRAFLSWLSYRVMLCTQYIRHHSQPAYTPEPDIVHEAIGHIPMFTNPNFADFSQFIGHGARIANDRQLEELGRLYWFTVEFGMVEHEGDIKAYGAGLLSSFGELEHAFSDQVERRPFNLEQVIDHEYTYSDMQPVLYVIPSYAELKEVTRKYIESFGSK